MTCHMMIKMSCVQLSVLFSISLVLFASPANGAPCVPYTIKPGHLVCVCNSTYCDTVPSADKQPKGQFVVFTTSRDGQRFDKVVSNSSSTPGTSDVYHINLNDSRQTIIGFGGAFTDAAGINIASLPQQAQIKLISSYYSKDGIEYSVGRVPMASCDFSTHPYSYDDVPGDLNLSKFSLAPEDLKYKIPYVQLALKMSPKQVKMFASPWSAPAWMKTNKNMTGEGSLIGQPGGPYYKAWANYFVKFLQEYAKNNISFWGVTGQNEPLDGLEKDFPFQAMGFTPELQRDFIKLDLGPALKNAGFGDVKIMILDDQRLAVFLWSKTVLSDLEASKFVSGIAVHWYTDAITPSNVLDMTHEEFPDKFLFATEACEGSNPWQEKVDLGAWDRGASYANDIITDLNNWVTGWTDWNIALDEKGGPNWVSNFVDSPIIVNAAKKEFYKQPMYYVLGHFSKYIVPGCVWIGTHSDKDNPLIQISAYLRPDKSVAVVIHNLGLQTVNLALTDGATGYHHVTSPGDSIQTVIWWMI